ncbi:MAG: hypothetical protein IJ397_07630 [Lachnospiraceae bacterium]|nr:hypothetical protein [Lachnospiraceae bacterium]
MKRRQPYKFTIKKISPWSVMSTILGVITLFSMVLAIIFTFRNQGEAKVGYGLTSILALLFSGTGLGLGIKTRLEKDMYYIFANIGIILNVLMLGFMIYILVLGMT